VVVKAEERRTVRRKSGFRSLAIGLMRFPRLFFAKAQDNMTGGRRLVYGDGLAAVELETGSLRRERSVIRVKECRLFALKVLVGVWVVVIMDIGRGGEVGCFIKRKVQVGDFGFPSFFPNAG